VYEIGYAIVLGMVVHTLLMWECTLVGYELNQMSCQILLFLASYVCSQMLCQILHSLASYGCSQILVMLEIMDRLR
jgi:hypothetical protein